MSQAFQHDPTKILQYVVYKNPKDYPDKFVVRQWTVEDGKEKALGAKVADDLEAARALVPFGLYNVGRFREDDPAIFEVWF